MVIRDTFPYTARWDSVGLDCSLCCHFADPPSWPDLERVSRCALHDVSLAVELGVNGYKSGEWFCRDFEERDPSKPPGLLARLLGKRPRAHASTAALHHLDEVRYSLQSEVLYGFYGEDGNLIEHPFTGLR